MNKLLKTGVSAIALTLVAVGPAAAFDEVDWSWKSKVHEHIDINVKIDAGDSFFPTGITQTERLQVSAGNMSASSNQDNTSFNVNPEGASGGPVKVDLGSLTVSGYYTEGGKDAHGSIDTSKVNSDVKGIEQTGFSAEKDKNEIEWKHKIDLGSITVDVPATGGNLDARVDLGRLEGNATAAANLATINSEAGTYFHDGQVAFGSYDTINNPVDVLQALGAALVASEVLPTGNRNMDALATAAIAAQFGLIKQGNITANASAVDVTDAQVALSATGAGNLHTVTVGPAYAPKFVGLSASGTPEYKTDNIVIGDLNQFNLMNVSATADASGLTVSGYQKLGKLKDQYGTWTAVSSVNASAFGNMSSVTNRVNGLAPLPYTSGN